MATKKNKEEKKEDKTNTEITSKAKLKSYLLNLRDKMTEDVAAPVYTLIAMNDLMNIPKIYSYLDEPNKEIARDIWLRIKQAGFQVKNPQLLFSE